MKKLLYCFVALYCAGQLVQGQNLATPATTPSSFTGMVELGFLYQDNKSNTPNTASTSPTVSVFGGHQFHRLFALGATVGLDFYNTVLITPLAIGIRGSLFDKRISPFYSLDMGYGSAFLSDESDNIKNRGGFMYNPGVGLKVATGNNTAFTLGLGYKRQRATTHTTWWNTTTLNNQYSFKRLSVKMGFTF